MAAFNLPLKIEQGTTYFLQFTWRAESVTEPGQPGDPVDLTGAELRMQIRKNQQSPVLAEASTTTGEITHSGPDGVITVKLPATATNELVSRTCAYDLEAVLSNGDVYRVIEGAVTVSPNITQVGGEPVVT